MTVDELIDVLEELDDDELLTLRAAIDEEIAERDEPIDFDDEDAFE